MPGEILTVTNADHEEEKLLLLLTILKRPTVVMGIVGLVGLFVWLASKGR